MKIFLIPICFVLMYQATGLAQEIEFIATLNRQVVGLNEQFELLLELSGSDAGDVPQPPVPDLNGFARFIGSSQASNFQFINGRMRTSKTYTLHYMATKEGKHQVPQIKFTYDGNNYSAGPLPFEVVARRSSRPQTRTPQQGGRTDDRQEDLSELLYLSASVDKKRVYLNEPVVITYRIYTALSVTNYGISQIPNTIGFWTEDFDTGKRPSVYTETVNGRAYKVAVIKKNALFAQSPGKKELGPMVVDCEVQLPASRKRSSDPFDSFFGDSFFRRTVTRKISSNLIDIEVLPLPGNNKPADFSGLVGSFDITASADKTTAKTNEAITLKVKINGVGNVKIIPQPVFDIPADFESYEPKIQENIQRSNNRISGSKTFEYVLVPRFVGQQRIKAITLSFFDPVAKAYKRVSTDAMDIEVQKGADQYTGVGIATSKEDVRFIGQDIRFIQTRLPDFEKRGIVIYKRWYFFVLLVLPWFAVASVWLFRRHSDKMLSNVAYARSRKASQMAGRFLNSASKELKTGKSREFYSEVSKALFGFLADKLNVAAAGLITDNVQELMRGRNVSAETISGYMACLEACDYQRFAPSDVDNGEMQAFLERARQAIIDLDGAL